MRKDTLKHIRINKKDASYIFDTNKAQVVSYDVMSSDQMVATEAEGFFGALIGFVARTVVDSIVYKIQHPENDWVIYSSGAAGTVYHPNLGSVQ